jgi:predicted nuclease with TOPRIM domain
MHTVRSLKQELERSTAGNMKVAKEMTWLEVKYTEARSELARVKHHNASLEEDVKDMVGLKLELAEATQRIAELESGRGGDDLM